MAARCMFGVFWWFTCTLIGHIHGLHLQDLSCNFTLGFCDWIGEGGHLVWTLDTNHTSGLFPNSSSGSYVYTRGSAFSAVNETKVGDDVRVAYLLAEDVEVGTQESAAMVLRWTSSANCSVQLQLILDNTTDVVWESWRSHQDVELWTEDRISLAEYLGNSSFLEMLMFKARLPEDSSIFAIDQIQIVDEGSTTISTIPSQSISTSTFSTNIPSTTSITTELPTISTLSTNNPSTSRTTDISTISTLSTINPSTSITTDISTIFTLKTNIPKTSLTTEHTKISTLSTNTQSTSLTTEHTTISTLSTNIPSISTSLSTEDVTTSPNSTHPLTTETPQIRQILLILNILIFTLIGVILLSLLILHCVLRRRRKRRDSTLVQPPSAPTLSDQPI